MENEAAAQSCQQCGFGLSLSRHAVLDAVAVAPGPGPEWPGEGERAPGDGPDGATEVNGLEAGPAAGPCGDQADSGAAAEVPAGPELAQLLESLRGEGPTYARWRALKTLGQLDASSPEILKGLLIARELGADEHTRDAAGTLLDSPPHRQVLEKHPELLEAAAAEVQLLRPPGAAPLGPLELPEALTGTGGQEPEPEPEGDAEELARAVRMQRRMTCILGLSLELLLSLLLGRHTRRRF